MNEGQAVNRGFFSRCIGLPALISFNTSLICKAQDNLCRIAVFNNRRTLYEDGIGTGLSKSCKGERRQKQTENPL